MLLETQQLEIISVNIWSILISLANLVIIFLLLKKLLFKPVKKTLAARQAQVDKIYDDAAAAKQTAEADRAEYEQSLPTSRPKPRRSSPTRASVPTE